MKKLILLFSSITALANAQTPSISFTENKGQIVDQHGNLNPTVKFILATRNNNIAIKSNGFCYNVYTTRKKETNLTKSFKKDSLFEDVDYIINRIDVEFLNLNQNIKILLDGKSTDFENYQNIVSNPKGINKVYGYNKITYLNIYNNIDVEFISNLNNEKGFEYNFILHNNANVNDIKLKYSGANKSNIINNTILSFNISNGILKETIPFSYILETKKPLNFSYKLLEKNTNYITVGFDGKALKEKNETIIIDPTPTLDLGTLYGGAGDDRAEEIKVDNVGNFYITGSTTSISNISTIGAYQTIYGGGNADMYVAKFNSLGQRKWATYYGGNDWEFGYGLGVTSLGEVYVSGKTTSTTNIASASAHQTVYGGGWYDAFLVKFDSMGVRLWGTYMGGAVDDQSNDLTIDQSGNIYLIGTTTSSTGISTPGVFQQNYLGNSDAFIAKFNPSGIRQWGTYFGEEVYGLAITCNSSNLFLTGTTSSSINIASPGAYQTSLTGSNNVFIASFNFSGARLWSTYFGGEATDEGYNIATDGFGNIFTCGKTNSAMGIATIGAYQTARSGPYDCFLNKFTSSGALVWSTYFGGETYDWANSIAINSSNDIYLTGTTKSQSLAVTAGAYQSTYSGSLNDAFMAKFNSNGSINWASYLGTAFIDVAYGAATYTNGAVYFCGVTSGGAGVGPLCTAGAYQTTYGGGSYDGFVTRFIDGGAIGIKENNLVNQNMKIYPNPNSGIFTIETNINTQICIYDVLGNLILKQTTNNTKTILDITNYKSGIYFVKVLEGNKVIAMQKIIKE